MRSNPWPLLLLGACGFLARPVPAAGDPSRHAALVKLLRAQPHRFRGKLTSYDPERGGVGFLMLTQDERLDGSALQAALGQALRPIPVDLSLLESLHPKTRLDFLSRWQQALGTK